MTRTRKETVLERRKAPGGVPEGFTVGQGGRRAPWGFLQQGERVLVVVLHLGGEPIPAPVPVPL